MTSELLLTAFPGNDFMTASLAAFLRAKIVPTEFHSFPDGESGVRFPSQFAGELKGRTLALVCTLDRPNEKFLPLMFAARTARELGAVHVGLVAPYLAYMRQDKRFHTGEALTSAIFAEGLSHSFDWLVTVDPHLHRLKSLDTLYRFPNRVVHAAPLIGNWIRDHARLPILIGPDEESEQWLSAIGVAIDAPHIALTKTRRDDQHVVVSVPALESYPNHTPVLIDDIISSGHTMIETVARVRKLGVPPPICVGIHAVFASAAYEALLAAGAQQVITTNTIAHKSNSIDVSSLVGEGIRELVSRVS